MTFWRPRKPGKALAVTFLGDGVTPSGIVALHHKDKYKMLAAVIEVNDTEVVEPGDIILYREGFAEDLITSEGDVFCLIDETNIITILDNFSLEQESKATTPLVFPI